MMGLSALSRTCVWLRQRSPRCSRGYTELEAETEHLEEIKYSMALEIEQKQRVVLHLGCVQDLSS